MRRFYSSARTVAARAATPIHANQDSAAAAKPISKPLVRRSLRRGVDRLREWAKGRLVECRPEDLLGCTHQLSNDLAPPIELLDDLTPADRLVKRLIPPSDAAGLQAERMLLSATPFATCLPAGPLSSEELLYLTRFRDPAERLLAYQTIHRLALHESQDDWLSRPPGQSVQLGRSLASLALEARLPADEKQPLLLDFSGYRNGHLEWRHLARQVLLCVQANYSAERPFHLVICGLNPRCVFHQYFSNVADGLSFEELPLDSVDSLEAAVRRYGRARLLYLSAFSSKEIANPEKLFQSNAPSAHWPTLALVVGVTASGIEATRLSVSRAEQFGLQHASLPLVSRCQSAGNRRFITGLPDLPIGQFTRFLLRLASTAGSWAVASYELPQRYLDSLGAWDSQHDGTPLPGMAFRKFYMIKTEDVLNMMTD